MKTTRLFLFAVLAAFFLNSCSKDDDTPGEIVPEGAYTDGFFILNEGSQTAGTVTYVSNDLQEVTQEIFQKNNEGDLGKYLQSAFFDEDYFYIISNGSNLITVVDRYTFELVETVDSGLQVPYYAAVVDGKAYVTNLAGFDTNTDDYIAVIDLETLEVGENITIGKSTQNILAEDGLLYIPHSTFDGTGNSISVVDPSTNSVEETIEVNQGLKSIAIENNTLYALTSGGVEKIDLETGETVSEITFPEEMPSVQNLDVEEGTIYYNVGNSVYAVATDATAPAEEALLSYGDSGSSYGVAYAFEVEDNRIYIGDAGDFKSNGFVEVYSTDGTFIEKIEAGVGPNNIYFNEL